MSKRTLCLAAAAALSLAFPGMDARAEERSVNIVRDGRPVALLALAKGRPVKISVLVDGKPPEHATWSSVPAGLLDVHDDGNGAVTIRSLKDLYDDPSGREPRGNVSVCVENACYSVGAVGLIDASGRWHAHIEVGGGIISRDRDLDLAQDGRRVTYGNIVLRLDGAMLRVVDGGGLLAHLNGSFSGSSKASGTWSSNRGFAGTWTVTR